VGTEMLDGFVANTEEYRNETDSNTQNTLKQEGFERFMAYIILRNSDQSKYGSVMGGLITQYSMDHDQYPKSITAAADILTNHRHDNYKQQRNTKQQKKEDNNKQKDDDSKNETSFAQSTKVPVCYCCGEKGHKSPECPQKDKIPKSEWAIRKAEQHLQSSEGKKEEEENTSTTSGVTNQESRKGWSGFQATF